jgi:hypothetical protein
MSGKMLILRGKQGLLDKGPAEEYAQRMGYTALTLDEPGMPNGPNAAQTKKALQLFRQDKNLDVHALYGFSGGGYNVFWILKALTDAEKSRLELVVVLGAKQDESALSRLTAGHKTKLVYREDPKGSSFEFHMGGPRRLLEEPH